MQLDLSQIANVAIGVIFSFIVIRIYQLGEKSAKNEANIHQTGQNINNLTTQIETLNANLIQLLERLNKLEERITHIQTSIQEMNPQIHSMSEDITIIKTALEIQGILKLKKKGGEENG